jgi:predicted ATP-grasp superfamily ATP-dependent carboligase
MANVLLTGGRAPVALELARIFHKAGYTVFMAESVRTHLSAPSHALRANFQVPPPRQQTAAYLAALRKIIVDHHIDLLIPTCEEVFYIAQGWEALAPYCTVFCEPLARLQPLHNKATFSELAHQFGLPVPETVLVDSPQALKAAFERWPKLVLKPVYSRFASRTLILPSLAAGLAAISRGPQKTLWVAQEYVLGQPICTYSIAHQGRLTAHTAYRSEFTAGQGATIVFQHSPHPAALEWVSRFVANYSYTGQIAFDFIENSSGDVLALECNPRATSGIHLFSSVSQFPAAFFDPNLECLAPPVAERSMLLTAMLLYGLPMALQKREFKKWLSTLRTSRDVVFSREDPLPALLQPCGILHFVRLGWQHHITPLEASTFDIEWNGEFPIQS